MKIRKTEPSVGILGKIVNLFSNSPKDTYSCEYLNDKFENIDISGAVGGDTLPIGSMLPYGNATPPENWLVCDGSAVSRTTYKELFEVIGTSYGAGDGSTTFNLPNKKGKVSVGLDSSDTDFNTIGKTGGEKTHKLTVDELAKHNHKQQGNTVKDTSASKLKVQMINANTINTTDTGTTLGADFGTGVAGENKAHNNLQPYQVDNWIIKAFQSSVVTAQVNNTESDSTTDTYSCNYINSKISEVVENGLNSSGGFTKFSDGTIHCYGTSSVITFTGAGVKDASVDLKAFGLKSNQNVQLTLMVNYSDYGNGKFQVHLKSSDINTITFSVRNEYTSNINFYVSWFVIGKWK